MSRQERKAYGTQDFRRYPFIETHPLPDVTLPSYLRYALTSGDGGSKKLGPRIVTSDWPAKHYHCRTTGKSYLSWENYMLHVNKLRPLLGPSTKDVLDVYVSPYDDRTFHYRENCKLHNLVKRHEEALETELVKRLDPDITDEDLELVVKKKRLQSRFWNRPVEKKVLDDQLEDLRRKRRIEEVEKDDSAEDVDEKINEFEVGDRPATNKGELFQRDLMSRPTLKWPENYDDLAPITLPPPVKRPAHRGWTHSDDTDSWYFEARTKGSYDDYNDFTKDLLEKKAICPRLWSTVFPLTERRDRDRELTCDRLTF